MEKHYRRENVMSKEKILIPVCEDSHWFLIVIDLNNSQLYCLDPYIPGPDKEKSLQLLYTQTLARLEHFRDNYLWE